MYRTLSLLAVLSMSAGTTHAQSLQDFIEGAEGEYGANLSIGMGYAEFLVSVTKAGVRVDIDGVMWNCTHVIDPATSMTYVSDQRRGTCGTGAFRGVRNDDRSLTFAIESLADPTTVPFLSRDMGDAWIETVPPAAVIRGIALGRPMPIASNEVEGYSVLQDRGRMSSFSWSSLGFMGFQRSNYFEGADYILLTEPRDLPNAAGSVSLDNLGAYGVDGRVVAVLRQYEPLEDEAPRHDAVQNALFSTYGEPSVTQRSGAGSVYEWHFDSDGTLLDSRASRSCENRFDSDQTDSRLVFLEQTVLETSLAEILQGRPARVENRYQQMKLRVAAECSYTIRYHIHPSAEGLLDRMTASMYAYDPVRTEIWGDRRRTLEDEIEEELNLQISSESITPDL